MLKLIPTLALLCLLCCCATVVTDNGEDTQSIITGSQATYSLGSALLKNTGIEVINIPDDGRKFDSLKDYIERRKDRFQPIFAKADAVVALTNSLPTDPLFRYAREANIHIVNIDATQPWSYAASGVTVVDAPTTNVSWAQISSERNPAQDSPYFWLSPSNAIRMADIVGNDLARVFPKQKKTIIENKDKLKQSLLELSREYQDNFLKVEDTAVFALANEFIYLTNDLGLYVDGYFLKQDIDWTESDLNQLTQNLESNGLKVVIHKWQPNQQIVDAINQAGAKLVVLDTADPGIKVNQKLAVDGYQQILRKNMALLYNAMK